MVSAAGKQIDLRSNLKPERLPWPYKNDCYPKLRGRGANAFSLTSNGVFNDALSLFVLSCPGEATGDDGGASPRGTYAGESESRSNPNHNPKVDYPLDGGASVCPDKRGLCHVIVTFRTRYFLP